MIQIPISYGELFDKISILKIKQDKILNPLKLILVQKELKALMNIGATLPIEKIISLYHSLQRINLRLWNVEDKLRKMELKGKFDQKFINAARSVYILNDKRFYYKNKINQILGSEISEVKQYVKYDTGKKEK